MRERLAAFNNEVSCVTHVCGEHANSSLINHLPFNELASCIKRVLYNLQIPHLPMVFKLPPESVAAVFRIKKPEPLIRIVVELIEYQQVLKSNTNPETPF